MKQVLTLCLDAWCAGKTLAQRTVELRQAGNRAWSHMLQGLIEKFDALDKLDVGQNA